MNYWFVQHKHNAITHEDASLIYCSPLFFAKIMLLLSTVFFLLGLES